MRDSAEVQQSCFICKKNYPKTRQFFKYGYGNLKGNYSVCHSCHGILSDLNQSLCVECGSIKLLSEDPMHQHACKRCHVNRNTRRRVRPRAGIVYFILCSELNRVKIGITSTSIRHRIHSMQGESPSPLECIGVIKSNQANLVEIELHNKFEEFNLWGEWFNFAPEIENYISLYALEPSTRVIAKGGKLPHTQVNAKRYKPLTIEALSIVLSSMTKALERMAS